MARRRPPQVRSRRRSRDLALEALEGRQLLAANVAVVDEAGPASTPFVRLVDAETGAVQASVMAFESTFRGGTRVALGRVTGNAAPDLVVGSGAGRVAEVRVFRPVTSGGTTTLTQVLSFQPFGPGYRGGIDVAVGDVDGDGIHDIIVGRSREGGDVKVFRMTNPGGTPTRTLYATIAKPFGPTFNGGASVGAADVGEFANGARVKNLGDNRMEILVGTGAGLPAQVRVYDISRPATPRVADTIVPFGPLFEGGVSVAGARYAATGVADSIDEIVVSAGRGGAAQTRIFDGTVSPAANTVLRSFATYATLARPNAPVFVAPVDVDGNGQVDRFLTTQGDPGGVPGISVVSLAGVRAPQPLTGFSGPLRVAAARTIFPTQSITGVVATPSPTSGVAAGSVRTMKTRDLVVGSGAAAATWDRLTVQYTGLLANGTVFDTSRQAGRTPFQLTVGAGEVIPGWEAGLVGMKVGGRRLLEIPPELAYGDAARPSIPGKSTLFFDVELVARTANSPATISGTSTGTVTEDAGTAVVTGTLAVSDPDPGQATFATPPSLAGTYGTFGFTPTTGAWVYTLDNSRPATQALAAGQTVTDSLTVTSRDGTASRAIVVTVAGANDAPTNIALSASTVADDSPSGTIVGTLGTTDTDASDTFTYALVAGAGSADNAAFSIAGNTLKTATTFDFEAKSSYAVRIKSTDSAGGAIEKQFTITVNDVNEAPSALTLSALSVSENAAAGTVVGTLATTDGDPGTAFTYALVSGTGDTDNADFTIVGDALRTAAVFDAETKNSYSIRVRSTDAGGLFIDRQFTITVANVNEPPSDVFLSAATVAENVATGTVVGTLSATDVDPGSTFTYALVSGTGDADNAAFAIDGSSLKTAAALDFETKSSYSIRVRATDEGGLSVEKPFTVTVTNVNDVATITGTSTAALVADGPTTTAGGTLTVLDGDAGQAGFAAPASLTSQRGDFTFAPATGVWGYTLNPGLLATAVLTADRKVTDSLTVTSLDGTASRTIEVEITGYTMQTLSATVPTPSPSAAVPAGSTSTMLYRDYATGTGAVAVPGALLTVDYYGLLVDDTMFDSSRLPGRDPFQFVLGAGQVITGWDAGVAGMRVGGLRVLSIPPELAYGDAARPSIPAGSRLVFVVELLGVQTPPT